MKKFAVSVLVFLALATGGAYAQSGGTSAPKEPAIESAIQMTKEKYEIGKIPQGEPYVFYMEFLNKTKKPLVVKNVMAGCGCTVPEKPTEPIMPGKLGKIKVSYSAPNVGPVNKDVEIYLAGFVEPKIIYFTGEVIAKK
ncbi:MAG TPA: DUF1573 domain-containing protein [Niabella sp.]|nr:DUF1573 domain-containing protein [Niabella sp.]HOZ97542.1 DUF1573 domain-containing protein [Niabella sp.]HQW15630.1 DUF1573 domain-containing protein [Niabella sp.]HQX20773.1 DUF1573 domain-containing protein [Niabella sp.]HQX41372.1 DUF1573 domain-containing protein [Niabella sp.]